MQVMSGRNFFRTVAEFIRLSGAAADGGERTRWQARTAKAREMSHKGALVSPSDDGSAVFNKFARERRISAQRGKFPALTM
jgi:hypothetical protein